MQYILFAEGRLTATYPNWDFQISKFADIKMFSFFFLMSIEEKNPGQDFNLKMFLALLHVQNFIFRFSTFWLFKILILDFLSSPYPTPWNHVSTPYIMKRRRPHPTPQNHVSPHPTPRKNVNLTFCMYNCNMSWKEIKKLMTLQHEF